MALILTGTVTLDCNDISCIAFSDTTGEYSLSNQNGYGGGVNPEIDEIVSVDFTLTDSDAVDWTYSAADYSPNAAGDSEICLTAADFLNSGDAIVLIPGATYTLTYTVHFSGSDYELQDEWVMPCCGNPITSNLGIRIAIEQMAGCASFVFSDITGAYDATDNPQGYGTPNPAYADITNTIISFELSNGETVNITSFIPTAADHSITIQASDLGYTTLIPDQIINVTYSVFTVGSCRVGYRNTSVLMYCQTEACINAKIATILDSDCSCDDSQQTQVDNVMKQLFELDALKIVAGRNMLCVDGKIEELFQRCSSACSNC